MSKTKEPKPHYVNSKVLLQQITDYYNKDDDEEMDPELAINIQKIAKGLSYAPNFINYSYKDDMIGDAVVKMFTALQNKKFDVTSGHNPFSYFTTIAFHAFINRIKKEKKYRSVVSEYQESVYDDIMGSDNDVDSNQRVNYTNPYDSEEN
jgi:DNA-directed RNA polymerase specialized sigma24 family protein